MKWWLRVVINFDLNKKSNPIELFKHEMVLLPRHMRIKQS